MRPWTRRFNIGQAELSAAKNVTSTKQHFEEEGMVFMGSLRMAQQAGYLTVLGCKKIGHPVTQCELTKVQHYAMLCSFFTELCIPDNDGRMRRPCMPVFFRGGSSNVFPVP